MRRLLLAAALCAATVSVSPANAAASGASPADAASRTGLRVATFNVSLNRPAQGLLREHLASPGVDDVYRRQASNVAEVIQRVRPDIVLLNEFDYDPEAARLFAD